MQAKMVLALLAAAAAGKQWWSHVQYLADDKREGRSVGSAGYDDAADYVAGQFERAGLQSVTQSVAFTKTTLNEADSGITLSASGSVTLGDEALITSTRNVAGLDAPLVFVGYGLDTSEAQAIELKGAIAVYIAGPGTIQTAGAIGTIRIPNPRTMEIPWARQSANRLLPRMSLSDPVFFTQSTLSFTATWNPLKADRLFEGSGHTIAEIFDAADHDRPLPRFTLSQSLHARVATTQDKVESRNIVGVRPGSGSGIKGAALKDEFVVLSAHLDHLGVGFNGAMDDASGIASLIEIARALQAGGVKTKRSILFLAATGEEKGLLGSRYFAQFPTVPGKLVADINMDMFLPLFPLRYLEVQGLNESTLGDDIRAATRTANVEVQADKEPGANRFIRSDQYSFIRRGIPALAFKFGWLPGSPEEKVFRDWYRDRYHAAGDDLAQPVDLEAAAQFNAILLSLLQRVANGRHAPQWKPTSPFKPSDPAVQSQAGKHAANLLR